MSLHFRVF